MIEYFTAMVIAYSVQDQEFETAVWFQSEKHCSSAMNSGSADGLTTICTIFTATT